MTTVRTSKAIQMVVASLTNAQASLDLDDKESPTVKILQGEIGQIDGFSFVTSPVRIIQRVGNWLIVDHFIRELTKMERFKLLLRMVRLDSLPTADSSYTKYIPSKPTL